MTIPRVSYYILLVLGINLLCSCSQMAGITPEQKVSLEEHYVGQEAWVKHDLGVNLWDKLGIGTHAYIVKVSIAPAVILHLQLDDKSVVEYNVNKKTRYNEIEVASRISESLVFGRKAAEEYFSVSSFSLTRDDGGSLRWNESDLQVELVVTEGNNIAARMWNTGSIPVNIDWQLSSLVDLNSQAHRIVPGSTRGKDVGSKIPPTVIPPGAQIFEILLPEDLIDLAQDTQRGLLPPAKANEHLLGLSGSLLLTIFSGDTTKYVSCNFMADSITQTGNIPEGSFTKNAYAPDYAR